VHPILPFYLRQARIYQSATGLTSSLEATLQGLQSKDIEQESRTKRPAAKEQRKCRQERQYINNMHKQSLSLSASLALSGG
jgi:hypothetical protein